MSRPRSLRFRLATAAVAAPLALSLVACGSDDDSDDVAEDAAERASTPSAAATTAAPESTSTEASAAPTGDTLLAAAQSASGAVEGSTAFSVDRDDAGGWEASVVTADGTEYDVRISADGSTVEGEPVEDTEDDGANEASRDVDERLRLLEVGVDLASAVEAASADAGSGELSGVDLDEDNGTATWEVQYGEDTPDELSVVVDAETGEVLRTERDD